MSEQTKKSAEATEKNLRAAEVYVKEADRHAFATGDKVLIQKVRKIKEAVNETANEISKRLGEGK
jgi:hypothetical protein